MAMTIPWGMLLCKLDLTQPLFSFVARVDLVVMSEGESWLGQPVEPYSESRAARVGHAVADWWRETTDVVILNSPWLKRSTGRALRCIWSCVHLGRWLMVIWCDLEFGRYSIGDKWSVQLAADAHASVLCLCALVFVGDKSR